VEVGQESLTSTAWSASGECRRQGDFMKFLLVNHDYPAFLNWFYSRQADLAERPFEEQTRVRAESLFGLADFFSRNLNQLGHEAYDIHVNNEFIQQAWAREHGLRVQEPSWRWQFRLRKRFIPWLSRVRDSSSMYEILAAQVKYYKPDVVFDLTTGGLTAPFLRDLKKLARLVIVLGEPPALLNNQDWGVYDLALMPSEGLVDHFRRRGIAVDLLRFGFEADVLARLDPGRRGSVPVSFVGSFWKPHRQRRKLLERACAELRGISVWGPSANDLPRKSPIRKRFVGPAWGRDSYQVLFDSKITLNSHIDIAREYADNMRLFEATGVGTLLLTDAKVNLPNMFTPGKEVVVYHTPQECVELARYFLDHEDERRAIAEAGQRRTLAEHTYCHRMEELVDVLAKHLRKAAS
jgi:hypothetical protein